MNKLFFTMIALLIISQLGLFQSVWADPVKKPKESEIEEKVLGKWNLVKSNGTEVSSTKIEFAKEGKLKIILGEKEDEIVLEGTFKITKEGIDYEIKSELHAKKEVLKIIKLEKDSMITEDPDGIKEEFERIVEKKK